MVKFAEVREGSIVQLGRFNKANAEHSFKSGIVASKQTVKIGKSVWSAITVQVGPKEFVVANINNIREVLA
jgi:hypothetical protein